MVGSKAAIRVDGKQTAAFDINAGVEQGAKLSTTLFHLVLEAPSQKLDTTGYIGVKTTQPCVYVYDIATICRNNKIKGEFCYTR